MNYKQIIVICMYLTLINNLSINAQTTINGRSKLAQRGRRLSFDATNIQKFPSRSIKPYELVFGVLFPNQGSHGLTEESVAGILPAMESAVRRIQQPGGILENFNITLEFRDTQCSSTYGALAAFELYTKRKPG